MKQKKSFPPLINLILIGLIIISFIVILVFGQRQNRYNQELSNKQAELIQKKKQLGDKQSRIKVKVLKNNITSTNPVVKGNAKQLTYTVSANKVVNHFFNILTTYNSSNDYRDRANKEKKYSSAGVYQNHKIFTDGKDSTGGDYINNLKLHSQFVSATLYGNAYDQTGINGLVQVSYRAWKDEEPSGDADDLYQIHYSALTGKLDKLKFIGSLQRQSEV